MQRREIFFVSLGREASRRESLFRAAFKSRRESLRGEAPVRSVGLGIEQLKSFQRRVAGSDRPPAELTARKTIWSGFPHRQFRYLQYRRASNEMGILRILGA